MDIRDSLYEDLDHLMYECKHYGKHNAESIRAIAQDLRGSIRDRTDNAYSRRTARDLKEAARYQLNACSMKTCFSCIDIDKEGCSLARWAMNLADRILSICSA